MCESPSIVKIQNDIVGRIEKLSHIIVKYDHNAPPLFTLIYLIYQTKKCLEQSKNIRPRLIYRESIQEWDECIDNMNYGLETFNEIFKAKYCFQLYSSS